MTSIYKDSSNKSCDHKLIAGADGDTSVIQTTYQGNRLYYISDQSGYYNIYRAGFKTSILPMSFDFGGSAPGYVLYTHLQEVFLKLILTHTAFYSS